MKSFYITKPRESARRRSDRVGWRNVRFDEETIRQTTSYDNKRGEEFAWISRIFEWLYTHDINSARSRVYTLNVQFTVIIA